MTFAREFIVTGATAGGAGVYHVIGRCGDAMLRVGDIFDQIRHPLDGVKPTRLTVSKIEAYQRSLEELGAGMTAALDVEGEGVEFLRPNAVLVSSPPSSGVIETTAAGKHV